MLINSDLVHWLDEWETRRQQEPALVPDEFMKALPPDVPADLRDELRRAIADLDWITEVMRRVKERDADASEPPARGS